MSSFPSSRKQRNLDPVSEHSGREDMLFSPGQIRLLIMDDDSSIGDLVCASLEGRGFFIDNLSDPTRLKEALEQNHYHLIILDYVLPGIQTEDALQWIRDHQPEASLIVMTAYPSVNSLHNALRARAFEYVEKPFSVQQFQDLVTRCLESKGLLRLSEAALRETLGRAIRDRRKEKGMTLAQMSERTTISLGYLSQIELGKNSASIETLYKISLGLGLPLSALFEELQDGT